MVATRWLTVDDDELINGAIGRARTLLERAATEKRAPAERLLRLLATPDGAAFVLVGCILAWPYLKWAGRI